MSAKKQLQSGKAFRRGETLSRSIIHVKTGKVPSFLSGVFYDGTPVDESRRTFMRNNASRCRRMEQSVLKRRPKRIKVET
jgi:hypothetical protein